ncbi:MAG: T9SS type A sorting domain-containing protein, partial [bacterium]
FYYDHDRTVNVAIIPVNWPVVIPAEGGSFNTTIYLTNHSPGPIPFDVWIDIQFPSGAITRPMLLREGLLFSSGQQISRYLTQFVPGTAPAGNYLYMAHTGDYTAGAISHETKMPFIKVGEPNESGENDFYCTESQQGFEVNESISLTEAALHASPNPFNALVSLSFELPESGWVSLRIYNLAGSRVATLLEGVYPAGKQEVKFNGNDLASGIYLAQLCTMHGSTIQRLLLLK